MVHIPKGMLFIPKKENANLKLYMHPNVHRSIIYDSQDMEAT